METDNSLEPSPRYPSSSLSHLSHSFCSASSPYRPPAAILGDGATPEAVARLAAEMGLDRPAPVLFFEWVGNALRGDFGRSYVTGLEVIRRDRAPHADHADPGPRRHLHSGGFSACPTGVIAALNRNSFIDPRAHWHRVGPAGHARLLAGAAAVLFFAVQDAMAARGRLHARLQPASGRWLRGFNPALPGTWSRCHRQHRPAHRAPRCWHSSTRNMPAP